MKKQESSRSSRYVIKWLRILSVVLMIGGVFAFGFIAWLSNVIEGTESYYDPIWMVGMLPLMLLIATPVNLFISRQVQRHLDTLTRSMEDVANGKSGVYIPTANADAFVDIYENFNKMAAEIEGIQRLRTEMIDSFSHELKTPVASINGFARLLLEEDISPEQRRKYLEIIVKESDRLAVLARDTLTLSKLDAQEILPNRVSYRLAPQIQECAINLEREWSAKNIDLTADFIEDATFCGNAELMASVWTNLLTNAIKFTPKNGEIKILMRQSGEYLSVSVSDTGIGMSQEVQEHIFERYYQGDTSHAAGGHGLGLAIVKRIVQLSGGSISVESREGEGSTFTVTLPKG